MANIYKNTKLDLTTNTVTTLYTVPSNSRAIIKSLLVSDDSGSGSNLTVAAPAASSAIKIDLTIALELEGTVYKTVSAVLVKLNF